METKVHVLHLLAVTVVTLVSVSWSASDVDTAVTLRLSQPANLRHTAQSACFEDFCRCHNKTADCSKNYGRLTYVPKLPANIRNLTFSYNNLTKISRDDFFQNVTRITTLDLSDNGLEYISQGAFSDLEDLCTLYLGRNILTYMAISPVFLAKGLSSLYLAYMDLGAIPKTWFFEKPMPPLMTLDLSGNRLQHLSLSVLSSVNTFTALVFKDCRTSSVTSAYFPHLELLDLRSNALFDLPESCRNGTSLFPLLRKIYFSENKFSGFHGEICLPKLEHLILSKNPITVVETDMFNSHRFPSLKMLWLESVVSLTKLEQFAFRGPTLKVLSLMFCGISFSSDVVHPDVFAGIPNLETLQISHNLGTGISEDKFNHLLGSLKNLKRLYIGIFDLFSISIDAFINSSSLTTLKLYGNKISDIPGGIFDSMKNLTVLDLNRNQIQVIRETTFSEATRQQLRSLDVSGNPFMCDCDILWFQNWLVSSPSLFSKHHRSYTCSNMDNMALKSFTMNEQACVFSTQTNKILIACVVLFLFLLLLLSVVFQYRWHIRLMVAFRGHGEIMRRRLMEEHFTYDVFLSCAEEDEDWVLRHLLPHLEGRQGLRACFHKRDFLPGKNILDNIVDSVKSSKKFVLVFSKHFALSRWCQFELDLCLGHVLDNDDALVVILLDDASSRDLTSTMKAVLGTMTYIQWQECPDVRASFWRRLELSLAEIMP
ncbi:toll-like receptor 4 [Babylonia areolata]|uniref:toll-like receptor 4 n=1 Tax=Babylonia areolata TaxID=304850 RepID=UPI003FD61D07